MFVLLFRNLFGGRETMKSELKAFVAVAVLTACAACVPVRETGNAGSVRIRFDMPEGTRSVNTAGAVLTDLGI